jgi:hypothetical protein
MVETSAEVADVLRVNRKALWMGFLVVVTLDSDAVELDLVSLILWILVVLSRDDLLFFFPPRT